MAGISLLAANLATVCIESLFYGILLLLSVASTYILARRQRTVDPRLPRRSTLRSLIVSPMFVGSAGLFIGNTMHWIVGLIRLFQAFIYFEGGTNPTAFYLDLSRKTYIAQLSALSFCIILGDAILIYRLWIVWAYSKFVIVIPLCSFVGYVVGVTYQTSRFRVGDNVNQVSAADWITPLWAFTICTNFYSTALIAWQVWRAHVAVSKSVNSRGPMRAIVTLVESAALYTAWNVFYYITYQLQSELQFVWNQTMPAVCGIAFMLINVRVGLRPALGTSAASNSGSSEMEFVSAMTTEHSHPTRGHDLESADTTCLQEPGRPRRVEEQPNRLPHEKVVLEQSDMEITTPN